MRRSLPIFIALLVLGVLAYWFGTRSAPLTPVPAREALVLGFASAPHALPAMIAEELGYFHAEGLDVTVKTYSNGKLALAAMLAKEVDVALAAETPIAISSASNPGIVVIASIMHTYASSKLVVANPAIRSIGELRGHRLGVIAGTNTQRFLHALIESNGLSVGDIIEVPIVPERAAAMLESGEIDAVAIFEPHATQLTVGANQQKRLILRSDRDWTSYNYATERQQVQRRSLAMARLLRATDRAIDWSRLHRQETIALMARRLGIDEAASAAILNEFTFALTLDQTLLLSLEDQAQWAMQVGLLPKGALPDYLNAIDLTIMQTVKPTSITIIR